jgi:precorrin-3B C17-methyltransferase
LNGKTIGSISVGKLIIAGIGPGGAEHMTAACREALENADIIAGYTGYVELVRPLYPEKSFLDTPMTGEEERCREALKLAQNGRQVCIISSGDSGVYGMASLLFELAEDYPGVCIEAIPGVTAASSGGALLGAPLGHDFAVISLSDRLTPWETIAGRLRAAAQGDFAICLYNPGLGTADKNGGEHIYGGFFQGLQGSKRRIFPGAANVPGKTAHPVRRQGFQQDAAGHPQMAPPACGGRVV